MTTKITPPQVRGQVCRTRLMELLDNGSRRSLVWITSPAGSGKTTLVADWLALREMPHLWYRLDAGDSDPASFFYYLSRAEAELHPRRKRRLPLLSAEYLRDIQTFSRRFFESLAAQCKVTTTSPLILVFDNFNELPDDSLLPSLLLKGVESLPEGMTMIVISRREAPPEFMRLLANQRLALIGWNDLRFSLAEVTDALNSWRDGHCQETVCPGPELLFERTDGWAAGLRLMIEAVEAQRASSRKESAESAGCHCIDSFGWKENVFSYFVCEVMERTGLSTCDFLMVTAWLPFITAPIAEALSGRPDASAILRDLSRRNFFTEWHPGPVPVYRYHPLFREFLQQRGAEEYSTEEIRLLREKGADLLAKAGFLQEAATLYCELEDFDQAIPLILQLARTLFDQGRSRTLDVWLSSLPKTMFEERPELMLIAGLCRLTRNLAEARALLERAFSGFVERGDYASAIRSAGGFLESLSIESSSLIEVDIWVDRATAAAEQGEQEVELAAEQVAGNVLMALGFHNLRHPAVDFWRVRAERAMMTCRDPAARLKLCNYLMTYYFLSGDFIAMKRGIAVVRSLRREAAQVPALHVLSLLMESYYLVHAEGDDERGIELARQGLEVGREGGVSIYSVWLALLIVAAATHTGNQELADGMVAELMVWAPTLSPLRQADMYHAAGMASAGRRAWREALEFFQRGLELTTRVEATFFSAYLRIESAKALWVMGDKRAARQALARVEADGWVGSELIRYREELTSAFFDLQAGERERGLEGLSMAFGRARRNSIRYVQFPDARDFALMCGEALAAGIETEFLGEVIRCHNLAPPDDALLRETWPWPLTIRTMGRFEILRDGQPFDLGGKVQKKPLELLKAIIAFGGREVPAERLLDALWPDLDADAAHAALKATLHRLRQGIGEGVILFKNGRLSLNEAQCRIDLLDFLALADRSASHAEANIQRILSLYTGPFLPGEEDAWWSVTPRNRCRELFVDLSVQAAEDFLQQGHCPEAAGCLERALDESPLDETLYLRLLECQGLLGRRDLVAQTFARCEKLLGEGLGIRPSAALRTLYDRLMSA